MRQQTFFEKEKGERAEGSEPVVLYALGDFQSRGKVLAERDLPLDRLRGALRRAADHLGVTELTDEQAAATLDALGARVQRVPAFIAKHPYRITVPAELAARALDFLTEQSRQRQ